MMTPDHIGSNYMFFSAKTSSCFLRDKVLWHTTNTFACDKDKVLLTYNKYF